MLLSSDRILEVPIMSLQTGGQLARTKSALIDPRNLSVVAFELEGNALNDYASLLRIEDIRELSNLGIIIDSSDEFILPNDVIKIKEIFDFHFIIIDKIVQDQKGKKLGKVTNYSVEPSSFLIKQIIVKRPLLKSFSDTELIFDRTQVIEVTNSTIIIDNDEREPTPVKRAQKAFSNPFRGQTVVPSETSFKS